MLLENENIKINNIKIHFTLNSIAKRKLFGHLLKDVKKGKIKLKFYNNFLVLKSNYTYIIFKNGTVNLTGLKGTSELENVFTRFSQDFQIQENLLPKEFIIDNITAHGTFNQQINLRKIQLFLEKDSNNTEIETKLNLSYFPALICKDYNKKGTILIFGSGNFTIVGVKREEDLKDIYFKASQLIKQSE